MNRLNELHGENTNEPPHEWNSKNTEVQFKPHNSAPNHSIVVSDITGRLNNNEVDNGGVEVYLLYYPLEYTSDSVPDPDNTPINSIGDDELGKIMELSHL